MGRRGEGGMEMGERKIIYLSLHCHHQNDSCMKMGSDESHFNVSLILRNKTVSTDHNFWRERRAEADLNRGPSAYQLNALPLGQTSSLTELRAAVALWSIQDDTEFQFNTDWCGDNKTTQCKNTCLPSPPPPPPPHTPTSREEIIVLLAKGEGWQKVQQVNLSACFVTTWWQNVPGWQNVLQI